MSAAMAEAQSEAQLIASQEALMELDDQAEEQSTQKFIEIVTDREKEFLQEDSDIDQSIDLMKSKQVDIVQ
jgi:hypothetical protein